VWVGRINGARSLSDTIAKSTDGMWLVVLISREYRCRRSSCFIKALKKKSSDGLGSKVATVVRPSHHESERHRCRSFPVIGGLTASPLIANRSSDVPWDWAELLTGSTFELARRVSK
jgi:hypothetical protein